MHLKKIVDRQKNKNLILSFLIFSLPLIFFIKNNINIIDKNILFNLIFINFLILIFFVISNYIINFFLKKEIINLYLFFSIFYNILFFHQDLKSILNSFSSYSFYLSFFFIILISLIIFFLLKKKKFLLFLKIYIFLNFFYIIIFFSFSLHTSLFNIKKIEDKNFSTIFQKEKGKLLSHENFRQNIYLIIMDGMTSLSHAKKNLNIEIDHHLSFLKQNNFYYENIHSNYNNTYLSFASMMDLDYVALPEDPKYLSRKKFWPYLMSNSKKKPILINELDKENYNFLWFGNMTSSCKNYSYDKSFCPKYNIDHSIYFPYYEFNVFLYNTPIITILRKFFKKTMLSFYNDGIDTISNFIVSDKNKNYINKRNYFTLIHHLSPHPPFIFNKNCEKKNFSGETSIISTDSKGYKDNYLCAIKKIEEVIKYLSEYDSNAYVIIMGDHGWNIEKNYKDTSDKELAQEKSKNYLALKMDQKCYKNIYEKLDNINVIRLVMGCAFNAETKLLKSKSFYGYQETDKNFGLIFKAF